MIYHKLPRPISMLPQKISLTQPLYTCIFPVATLNQSCLFIPEKDTEQVSKTELKLILKPKQ